MMIMMIKLKGTELGFPQTAPRLAKGIVFRCIITVVFYLQLNSRSFESKHNYLMLLSLFKLTTCFGL